MSLAALVLVAAASISTGTLDDKVAKVLPQAADDKFLEVGWRTNLMEARVESQKTGKPIFLWIMVGNPQGTT
jgi:hypothetical protein